MYRTLTLIAASLVLSACASLDNLPRPLAESGGARPEVLAACPPLTPVKRTDTDDALSLRVAEVERWYVMCRAAALDPAPRRWRPTSRAAALLAR